MTAFLREWILGIVTVSLLSGGVKAVAGGGSSSGALRLIAALLQLLAVLLPLQQNGAEVFSAAYQDWRIRSRAEQSLVQETGTALYTSALAETLAGEIVRRAKDAGILCQAELHLQQQDDLLLPSACHITGVSDDADRRVLREIVQTVTGEITLTFEKG